MASAGQTTVHLPQPVHLSFSLCTFPSLIVRALAAQLSTHRLQSKPFNRLRKHLLSTISATGVMPAVVAMSEDVVVTMTQSRPAP
jgi:sulfite exporter TauE/SafE